MATLPPKKARQQREYLLVSQWVVTNYPGSPILLQQRVGPIQNSPQTEGLTRAEKLSLGNFRRVADAIVLLPTEVLIIEGYVHVNLGKLSQLMTYLQLAPLTPELGDHVHKPIRGMLLGAQRDPILDQMAARFNIPVVIFQPEWVKSYLATVYDRSARTRENVVLPSESES